MGQPKKKKKKDERFHTLMPHEIFLSPSDPLHLLLFPARAAPGGKGEEGAEAPPAPRSAPGGKGEGAPRPRPPRRLPGAEALPPAGLSGATLQSGGWGWRRAACGGPTEGQGA